MKKRTGYNPKRRIAPVGILSAEAREKQRSLAKYGGNPEHKRSPGDYGLTPPAQPRPGKTLCDGERPLLKEEAEKMLREGLCKGLTSICDTHVWPQNVWSVSEKLEVFEAQLENPEQGIYHGYPMPMDDDFRNVVLKEWAAR